MDYRALSLEFFSCLHRLAKVKTVRESNALGEGEEHVLNFIADHEETVTPGMLSSAAGISTARIAATLNRLEEKGDITRRIDKKDRRKIIVELTPAGRDRLHEIRKEKLGRMAAFLERLGEEDARELIRLTGRVCSIFEMGNWEKNLEYL